MKCCTHNVIQYICWSWGSNWMSVCYYLKILAIQKMTGSKPTVQFCALSFFFILRVKLSCSPSFFPLLTPSPPARAVSPPAFQRQWLLCRGAVVFVCALLTMAACSPPGSPVCQRWLQQNRLWEQPVSLLWSPAPQPEGQPSIQRSPCPCAHKCPTKHTLTQKAYNAHTLSQ